MARVRVSTTVDEELLEAARRTRAGAPDSVVVDAALAALLRAERGAAVDKAYEAYDTAPPDVPDEWGDLASWREAAARS